MSKKIAGCAAVLLLILQRAVYGQPVPPGQDAAIVYLHAADLVVANYGKNVMAPAASNTEYPAYPPFPDEWMTMEKTDFGANAPARDLAHQARAMSRANWPLHQSTERIKYLNRCRALASDLADAAMYQHLQGDDAAAAESLLDLLRFADVLENEPRDRSLIRILVSIGLDALAADRAEIIFANVGLTKDAKETRHLQLDSAAKLIRQFSTFEGAEAELAAVAKAEGAPFNSITEPAFKRIIATLKRRNAECNLAAMSLACHLYQFDTGHWPRSLADVQPRLPTPPVDPFGDGKQLLGYTLIQGGLPDGSDRPLVYSRCSSKDGLFYRTDSPLYGFYSSDGSNLPIAQQKHGGQFRDVSFWTPNPGDVPEATTQPIPQ